MPEKALCSAFLSKAVWTMAVEKHESISSDTSTKSKVDVPALLVWRSWGSIPRAKSLLRAYQAGNCHGRRLDNAPYVFPLPSVLIELTKSQAKVISFTDLAGHERYLRTTVFGLLSSEPNYCLLMVAANNGLIGMSKEHLGIALALNVPVMVVITKIDICPPQILEQTITQLSKILKSPGARKIPIFVKTHEECIQTATQFVSRRICPIFQVSNVTGESLDLVRTFLNILPHHGNYNPDAAFEFHVNDTFSVPFVGTVVSGVVKSGVIHAGDNVLIGPDSIGQFTTTKVRSIERKRIGVPVAAAGQSASFSLRNVRRRDVRKGMVVLHKPENPLHMPKVYREFIAEVLILSHATTIKVKYQAMLHVGPVSQTCAIIDIDRNFIRTGDRATVAFRFVQRPEYLAVGDRILFREGRTKGLGIVKQVGYDKEKPLNPEGIKERETERNGNGIGGSKDG
jgi:GTPase